MRVSVYLLLSIPQQKRFLSSLLASADNGGSYRDKRRFFVFINQVSSYIMMLSGTTQPYYSPIIPVIFPVILHWNFPVYFLWWKKYSIPPSSFWNIFQKYKVIKNVMPYLPHTLHSTKKDMKYNPNGRFESSQKSSLYNCYNRIDLESKCCRGKNKIDLKEYYLYYPRWFKQPINWRFKKH